MTPRKKWTGVRLDVRMLANGRIQLYGTKSGLIRNYVNIATSNVPALIKKLQSAIQAAPPAAPCEVTESLVRELHARDEKGRAKYGTTLDRGDLKPDEWAQHLLEELLEQAVLPAELKTTLVARAGGNPLYAEEFVTPLQ